MNQLLPYEESIAQKLEELPLPDMKEAIWNSIQVKIGTSGPDAVNNGAGISQKAGLSNDKIIIGCIILIIVVVTIIVVNSKKKTTQDIKKVPAITQPQAPINDNPLQEEERKKSTVPFRKADTASAFPHTISRDTLAIISPVFPQVIKPDSNRQVAPVVPLKDSIAKPPDTRPKQKSIGVLGISDSSYRISGKKDSI